MSQTQKHCYLFALEIAPLTVGESYRTLPMHCTLMHRFWATQSPAELASKVALIFKKYVDGITFIPGKIMELGPNNTVVFELEQTETLRRLHMELYNLLNSLGVEYTEADWVGSGYTPHASDREDSPLKQGKPFTAKRVNLIEVKVPGHDHMRFVREKLSLG